jgi:hypothetical protein
MKEGDDWFPLGGVKVVDEAQYLLWQAHDVVSMVFQLEHLLPRLLEELLWSL